MTTINVGMEVLPNEQLQILLDSLPEGSTVIPMIEAILASRAAEDNARLAAEAFGIETLELVALLPKPPKGIYNLYYRYAEVVEELDQPEEPVAINGITSMRKPTTKVWKWIVEVNHACKHSNATGGAGSNKEATTKRAISVYQKSTSGLDLLGNFRNGVEACLHLGFGDEAKKVGVNAKRDVLVPKGYVVTDYDGTEYLVAKAS